MKRAFDIFFSFAGILLCLPLFAASALAIKLDSRGPVFFRQERIGRGLKAFRIYKFRTMEQEGTAGAAWPEITVRGDARVTRVGKFLRKYKIDELPQLINVFKGEMSLVGPRPEVPRYVELFRKDFEKLLAVRPGITDPASLRYADEEAALSSHGDWEKEYLTHILPDKIKLSAGYIGRSSLTGDIKLILKTLFRSWTA